MHKCKCSVIHAGPLLMSLRPGAKALDSTEEETPANQDAEHPPDIIADLQDWTEDDTESHDWISSRTCSDLSRTEPSEVRRKQRSGHVVFSQVRGCNAVHLNLAGVVSPDSESAGATQAERRENTRTGAGAEEHAKPHESVLLTGANHSSWPITAANHSRDCYNDVENTESCELCV